jgi:DNA-binding transcriptional LysR family regulator
MCVSLSSSQLDAFVAVANSGTFSAAAKLLHITQSALSQRVLNLEQELGTSLFIRETSGILITETGQRLLRYCQMKNSLEAELLGDFGPQRGKSLRGLVKIGAFSTVARSVLVPSLSDLLAKNPEVQIELHTKEVRDLSALLEMGRADFVLINSPYEKNGVENFHLGFEENVLVEPKSGTYRKDVFLDHDSEDSTTRDFFKIQSKHPEKWKRSYFDEIYTIIDGVLMGAGRAVIPLHLARQVKGLSIVRGYRSMKTPVYLCYFHQAFYTLLQKQVIENIKTSAPKFLKPIL